MVTIWELVCVCVGSMSWSCLDSSADRMGLGLGSGLGSGWCWRCCMVECRFILNEMSVLSSSSSGICGNSVASCSMMYDGT